MATREVSELERPALRVKESTYIGDPEKDLYAKASYEKEPFATDAHAEDVTGRGAPTPVPKYSSRWWTRTWDKMVKEATWPRTFYSLAFLILLGVWIGVMAAFGHNQTNYENGNKLAFGHHLLSSGNDPNLATIGLRGTLVSWDPSKRSLTVTWAGIYKPSDSDPNNPNDVRLLGNVSDSESLWSDGIAIFRDVEAIPFYYPFNKQANNETVPYDAANATTSPDIPDYNNTGDTGIWVYSVDNRTALPIAVVGLRTWDSFDTDIPFNQATDEVTREPGFGYPFDKWEGNIVFIAADYSYQSIFNSSGAFVMEIGGVQLFDSTLNWRFTLNQQNTCKNYSSTDFFNHSSFGETCHMELTFTAERTGLVMFAATIAVIVNWLSTVFIFILTSESIILRRAYMLEGTDLLSVCFTALFALPSVRSLLPGAPDFGALIDLVGIIPNVIIISLCTCIVCVAKLYRSPDYERARAEKQD